MPESPDDPNQATIGDVFRVVNEMRREVRAELSDVRSELSDIRGELAEFRIEVGQRFDRFGRRVEGQTESALNVALHVLGEQREKLRALVTWARAQGAEIDNLP